MPADFMDWIVVLSFAVAAVGVLIAWRQKRAKSGGVVQNMTNSRGSTQNATREDVQQSMDDVTDGEQNS